MEPLLHQCFPAPGGERALTGLYLHDPLPTQGRHGPFIYANYVQSLDGRIAIPDAKGRSHVPGSIGNPRDWRLLQELAGQADCLLSSGRYLRELDAGTAQDILPIGSSEAFADIHAFRTQQGLSAQPDVVVLSASLDFPAPQRLLTQGRAVRVLTGTQAPDARVQALEQAGLEVIALPGGRNPGGPALAKALASLGYARIYAITGPYVFHTLLSAGLLDALFLTTVHRVLAGQPFASICEGETLAEPTDFELAAYYLDPAGPGGCAQSFARYHRQP